MYSKGSLAVVAVLAVGLTVLAADRPAPQPAAETPKGDMMSQCMEHCRAVSKSIDETIKVIEEAKGSNEPDRMRAALEKAQTQLSGMKQHISECVAMMPKMTDEKSQAVWTCPMHPEIRQDKPGKCPICKMDLVKAKPTGK